MHDERLVDSDAFERGRIVGVSLLLGEQSFAFQRGDTSRSSGGLFVTDRQRRNPDERSVERIAGRTSANVRLPVGTWNPVRLQRQRLP